ncbi:MAG: winged helix-turn-helix transcriptional regulator [Candidatus Magasanikbacteria bacterium]|nr:winged helix-turn-helix transcriptional regulator [Candidatus Magasanikbacteria bacterium]
MLTTEQKIVDLIRKQGGISAHDIISQLAKNASGIFRHLKNLQEKKIIYKVGNPPSVRYYEYANSMKNNSALVINSINWAISGDNNLFGSREHCQTRDVFQARCDRLAGVIKKILNNENIGFLMAAVVGEIGNNSFDHNIGQWLGLPGLIYILDEVNKIIIMADRGQGVLATLKRVRPALADHMQALQVAFTEKISGRAPEQRGNGLKFVKKVIIENNWRLTYYSGNAVAEINSGGLSIFESPTTIPGTLAVINF